jgi:hypothetical protein
MIRNSVIYDKAFTQLMRKLQLYYTSMNSSDKVADLWPDLTGQSASNLIKTFIVQDQPCMICRFGSGELDVTLRHLFMKSKDPLISKFLDFIKGKSSPFWWDKSIKNNISNNAGYYPVDDCSLSAFGEKMLEDITEIDVLGIWQGDEKYLRSFFPKAHLVFLQDLEPYYHKDPWSEALKDMTVLVIHPFEKSIINQYKKRDLLFEDTRILPEFNLKTLKSVQSAAREYTEFPTWFDSFNYMCDQIDQTNFDVAIIGAGAYGLPLAAYIKRIGKKSIHLGGATQILFGIRGKRWDERPFFQNLYNEHWIRPLISETPSQFSTIESGCYW